MGYEAFISEAGINEYVLCLLKCISILQVYFNIVEGVSWVRSLLLRVVVRSGLVCY